MPCPFKSLFLAFAYTSCVSLPALARTDADEHQRLALVLRQLDAAARISAPKAAVTDPTDRYAFDYDRLSTDLDLIRQGINGYLTPSRAQPRNPTELTGHYTRSIKDQP
ncbi:MULTISPECIES: RAQPRD family integrative conjugative element protein [Pseudomonas]|uniref:integrative conjugative element protein, RAQPRD family n=1 Tax=Pseudomonas TaxID=286 RepID=UPI000CFDB7B1|nr:MULTISPECIES: RAQPRD family integrative conjugative element protein [Pseudomonas]PQZ91020.1 raqprd family integrative conjugative element protein [Pseudomonas trivialis]PRB26252.1 raqprd family integrative conjugative element protein [Pseudomonas sp. MYb60]